MMKTKDAKRVQSVYIEEETIDYLQSEGYNISVLVNRELKDFVKKDRKAKGK